MSYLSTIERYHDYRNAIRELLGSILTGISHSRLFTEPKALEEAMCDLARHYPFVALLFTLDARGIQSSDNIVCPKRNGRALGDGRGKDRSQRPYFVLVRDADTVVVTEPYLSITGGALCISAAVRCRAPDGGVLGCTVIDIDLGETVEFLMGDVARRRFQPAFRAVYTTIVVGLFAVVGLLLWAAVGEVVSLFAGDVVGEDLHLKPFGVIIFLTLALAIFDLGKTILEEEVLMHKDIFRHSSTRRTITRFVAAILIAVSIEALLLMFKAALGGGEGMVAAVMMMVTAVGLLVGLGVYVFLGARAEVALLRQRGTSR
jgi:hypothetical protein